MLSKKIALHLVFRVQTGENRESNAGGLHHCLNRGLLPNLYKATYTSLTTMVIPVLKLMMGFPW